MGENEKRISWNFWRTGLGGGWSINYRKMSKCRQLSGNFGSQRFIFVYLTAQQVFEAQKARMIAEGKAAARLAEIAQRFEGRGE